MVNNIDKRLTLQHTQIWLLLTLDLWAENINVSGWTSSFKCASSNTHTHTRAGTHARAHAHTHTRARTHTHAHIHTHTYVGFYTVQTVCAIALHPPTTKLSPHRRLCAFLLSPKNSLCMIYKHFELWGHWECPHKSPFLVMPVISMSLYTFVSS